MSTETNKASARRFIEEGVTQGKVAVLDELCTPNLIYHNPTRPDARTLEDLKRLVTEDRSAFSDPRVTIEDMIAEGEQVATRLTSRATFTSDLVMPTMRVPATGKQITVTGMFILRFADGKVVEVWDQGDDLGTFQQLGLIPVPQPVG